MNPVSEDIKDVLVRVGVGIFAKADGDGWSIFLVEEPEEPNNTVTVFESESVGGVAKSYDTGNDFNKSGFQLRVRGPSWLEARKKIESVALKINRIGKFAAADGTKYNNIVINGEPKFLAKDQKGRFIWIVYGVGFRQKGN